LLEDAGFLVKVADDGLSGIAAFESWQPHFIWMDIRMPGIDGIETATRIRALEGGPRVKIAALTASVFDEQRGEVMAAGLDDFVRKPYRPSEIFECMGRHLDIMFSDAEAEGAVGRESAGVSTAAEALATLPRDLRDELARALVSTDPARIAVVVGRVSALDPVQGRRIADQVEGLEYTPLLRALRAVETVATGEGS
jgi:CheY-like chemotaxis protein